MEADQAEVEGGSSEMNGRLISFIVVAAAAVGAAYYVGSRLSTEALNMAVGLMCGLLATVPVTLGLLIALLRKRTDDDEVVEEQNGWRDFPGRYGSYRPGHPQQPQIIVIAPPQPQGLGGFPYSNGSPGFTAYPSPMREDVIDSRDWKIIGDDEG